MKLALPLAAAAAALTLAAPAAASQSNSARTPVTSHDRSVIRFFQHHPKQAATPAGGKALAAVLPHVVRQIQLRAIQDAAARSVFPPHHALWECIHRYEGSWDSRAGQTGPGQYGGLQMSWNWLGYINGNAGNMTQAEQEWAAEKAWQNNGYSYSFLVGQWYSWDAADGCGTTG